MVIVIVNKLDFIVLVLRVMGEFGVLFGKIREELGCGKDRIEICLFRYWLLFIVIFVEFFFVGSFGEFVLKLININI